MSDDPRVGAADSWGDPPARAPEPSAATSPFVSTGNPFAPTTEADYARGRLTSRTYLSRSFPIRAPSRDAGHPGRYVHKVFDCLPLGERDMSYDWTEEIVVDGARRQIRLLIAREAGQIKEMRIWRIPTTGDHEELLGLDRDDSGRLINMLRALDHVPAEGDTTVRLDDDLIRDVLADPAGMRRAYDRDPGKFADLISDDVSASDVIAIANRRQRLEEFRRLLSEPDYFALVRDSIGQGPEAVWQRFLEENPWILGIGLTGQLLTSWNADKLEQVVTGSTITTPGKRVDALLRTAGAINSMVFAEIKHHETDLLESTPYRTDCWAPSRELAGGVTQIQQTMYLAREHLTEAVRGTDEDGFEDGSVTYLIRPRCYLIAGHLGQLGRPGRVNMAKLRSFELYRRNLYEPEIITYDELLVRAEWHLAEAEREAEQRHA